MVTADNVSINILNKLFSMNFESSSSDPYLCHKCNIANNVIKWSPDSLLFGMKNCYILDSINSGSKLFLGLTAH